MLCAGGVEKRSPGSEGCGRQTAASPCQRPPPGRARPSGAPVGGRARGAANRGPGQGVAHGPHSSGRASPLPSATGKSHCGAGVSATRPRPGARLGHTPACRASQRPSPIACTRLVDGDCQNVLVKSVTESSSGLDDLHRWVPRRSASGLSADPPISSARPQPDCKAAKSDLKAGLHCALFVRHSDESSLLFWTDTGPGARPRALSRPVRLHPLIPWQLKESS